MKKITSIIQLIILVVIIISCSVKGNPDEEQTQKAISNSILKINSQSVQFLNGIQKKIELVNGKNINHLTIEVNSDNFKTVLSSFNFDLLKNADKVIIYSNSQDLKNIYSKEVKAVSVFNKREDTNSFDHSLYEKKGNDFIENIGYKAVSEMAIYHSDINQIAQNLNEVNNWVLIKKIGDKFRKASQINTEASNFRSKVLDNSEFIDNFSIAEQCHGQSGTSCGLESGAECVDGGCYASGGGGCDSEQAARVSVGGSLDLEVARVFRDSFLSNYKMGKKYTEYYYKISKVSNLSKVKRDNLSQERKRVISDGIEIAKIFMYGDDNEIIYDNVKTKEAKGLISEYKKMSNNREFQFILKDIEKDLDNLKGKTKGEIMVLIGNE